ncbi:MAG: chemotaxis protein CheW [Myxococcota bacterium]
MSNTDNPTQVLTFIVDGAEYGVDILRVQEIRGWTQPVPLPNSPTYVRGVINIRGDIVPITDLRQRLGMATVQHGPMSAVIVLRSDERAGSRAMGIVVDAMSDVSTLAEDSLKPPPDFGDQGAKLARAIVTAGEKLITILDVDQLFGPRLGLAA